MKEQLIVWLIMLMSASMFSQDYFAIVKKNDSVTYNYPPYAKIKLIDADGNITMIGEDESIEVEGDYRLEIDVPWSEEPEIINADGGALEIFVLPTTAWNDGWEEEHIETKVNTYTTIAGKDVYLERKMVTISENNPESYNGLFVFTNGFVFSYEDGIARGYQDGKKLKVEGKYLVYGDSEILKLSFNPKTGKMWYVFERNQ